jgi:hypothetical protein
MDYGKTTNDTLYESSGSWLRFRTSSQPLPVGTIRVGFMVGHNSDHNLKTVDPTGVLTNRGTWTYVGVGNSDYTESIEWQSQVWDFQLNVNITDWSYLFADNILMLTDVVGINIIDANAYGVNTMEGMFKNSYINNILSIRNTESCLNTSYMFFHVVTNVHPSIQGVHFTAPNCTDASYMFYGRDLDVTWDYPNDRYEFSATGNCVDMSYMFYNVQFNDSSYSRRPPYLDMSSCVNASYMFYDSNIKEFPYDTSNVQNMSHMLDSADKITGFLNISLASCTNAESLFANCRFTSISPLDISHCTNTKRMFYSCILLEQVSLTSACLTETTEQMFYACRVLKSVPLFDTSRSTTVYQMFVQCWALEAIPLFDTSNATTGNGFAMGAHVITQIPLINTSKMTDVAYMFDGCYMVESGALALYNQMSTQASPPSRHDSAFRNCGRDTASGSAEVAQIPTSWGGTQA